MGRWGVGGVRVTLAETANGRSGWKRKDSRKKMPGKQHAGRIFMSNKAPIPREIHGPQSNTANSQDGAQDGERVAKTPSRKPSWRTCIHMCSQDGEQAAGAAKSQGGVQVLEVTGAPIPRRASLLRSRKRPSGYYRDADRVFAISVSYFRCFCEKQGAGRDASPR